MGSGGSKVAAEGAKQPTKAFSLRRRYEEIGRRQNSKIRFAGKGATPSKKSLLQHGGDDGATIHSDDEKRTRIHQNDGRDDEKPLSGRDAEPNNKGHAERDVKRGVSSVDRETRSGDERHGDDECTYPGSPSFRIYYLDSLNNNHNHNLGSRKKEKDHDGNEGVKNEVIDVSKESNDASYLMASDTKKVKKSKKEKRWRMIFQRGGLVDVRSCYSSSHERMHLLAGKSVV